MRRFYPRYRYWLGLSGPSASLQICLKGAGDDSEASRYDVKTGHN